MEKSTPQGMGSAYTYGRRYGLAALLGIVADEDDDGNAASAPAKAPEPRREKKKTLQERSNPDLVNLRQWASDNQKTKLVDQIDEELERRRDQSNTPLDKVPPALATDPDAEELERLGIQLEPSR